MNYKLRREKIYEWMAEESMSLVVFEDSERSRDPSIRYLCGHPGDALLFLSVEQKCLLVPWDIHLARQIAEVDATIPYPKFDLDPYAATRGAADFFRVPYGGKLEVPPATSYPSFLSYVEHLGDFDVLCRSGGARSVVEKNRAVKDEDEIELLRQCAVRTNALIKRIEDMVRDETLKTEADVALFIEKDCRALECDGTSFTTLAAGPSRSFGIHSFPPYTSGAFATKGLSILDFGIVYQGYTSDVTLTFARALSKTQEKQLALVEEAFVLAYDIVAAAFTPGKRTPSLTGREVALAVDLLFKKYGMVMPHGLGHGIGLEPHEGPYLRRSAKNTWQLETGHVFTIEPGLYDGDYGGCRLENDVLLSPTGAEILTKSKIIRL